MLLNQQHLPKELPNPSTASGGRGDTMQSQLKNDWNELCTGPGDVEAGLRYFEASYAGARPEAFKDTGRYKTRGGTSCCAAKTVGVARWARRGCLPDSRLNCGASLSVTYRS